MANPYITHTNPETTPATEPIFGREEEMAPNHGGGFSFTIDEFSQLRRFLILGTEGGTYYMNEKQHTLENIQVVVAAAKRDGARVLAEIVAISESGRAMRKAPAIWALAYLLKKHEDVEIRRAAAFVVPRVCAIGTDILMLAECVKSLGGWSHAVGHRAFETWMFSRTPEQMAFQMVKYQNREKWRMRDLLRKVKPVPENEMRSRVFRWVTKGWEGEVGVEPPADIPTILWAFERAKTVKGKELADLIEKYRLPRECLPTEALDDPGVWEALLPHMGGTALVRNLGKMTAIGLLAPLSDATKLVTDKLADAEYVQSFKLHPLRTLIARKVYEQGHGEKGKLSWKAVPAIVGALDSAFYSGFGVLKPTGKKHLLALDVSGSMTTQMSGTPITCHEATAALAMIRARLESEVYVMGFSHHFVDLGITGDMTLGEAMKRTCLSDFGSTDVSLPMEWALKNKIEVDVVEVLTDNEVNTGTHPTEILKKYRKQMERPTRQVVVGMTATGFSVADPKDPGQLDVVGFDAALPEVINNFLEA